MKLELVQAVLCDLRFDILALSLAVTPMFLFIRANNNTGVVQQATNNSIRSKVGSTISGLDPSTSAYGNHVCYVDDKCVQGPILPPLPAGRGEALQQRWNPRERLEHFIATKMPNDLHMYRVAERGPI